MNTEPIRAISPELNYESGKTLMEKGSQTLHEVMANRIERAKGRPLPEMEVRFSNLSLSADIVVADDQATKYELPTLTNELKKTLMGPKKLTVRKEILKNVSGRFTPGKITLLLGQPGSGKSALMKVLGGRFPMTKNITLEGDISFNSVSRGDLVDRLPQFVEYVGQRDYHSATLTVAEMLEFASKFCGGELLKQGKGMLDMSSRHDDFQALEDAKAIFAHYTDVVMKQYGLKICKDTIVGDAMLRGVSGGERKRVTTSEMEFGMKYVSLMDEIMWRTLHKTVVIALLQPSPEVFALFDDVMILNDGELMYHGPCSKVEGYFETLGFKCPPGRDIADYLLDLGAKQQHRYEVPHPVKQPRSARSQACQKRAASSMTQMKFVVTRFMQMYWCTPSYNLTRMYLAIFLALLLGLIFVGNSGFSSYSGLNSGVGMVFMVSLFSSMAVFQSVMPLSCAERAPYYRERAFQTYNAFWYFVSSTVVEIPYCFVSTFLFTFIFYYFVGFTGFTPAVLFWLACSLLVLMEVYLGQFFSFSPPAYAIPSAYTWLYDICPIKFPMSILIALVFSDCDHLPTWNEASQSYINVNSQVGCQPMTNAPETVEHITIKEYTEYFGFKHHQILRNFGITIGVIVLFRIWAALALRYINHQTKWSDTLYMLTTVRTGPIKLPLVASLASEMLTRSIEPIEIEEKITVL
ncbi:hypothetical protein V7S43_003947 [Phytophthora oleae]|uniref:ABC transporter domain-containing protein n=1 Tax=Phytophthora oleae TaxID=2107226 RepID=A0ABD3G0N0_9STRA